MNKLFEKHVSSERIFKGHLLQLRVDTVETPSGKQATRDVVEHPGAVAVVAITPEKELVLVRQYRKPVGDVLLEIPAGVPKAKESGERCALRELEEETGFRAEEVKKIWEGYSSPGYSDEVIRFYLAEYLVPGEPHTDEDECIEVELLSVDRCLSMLKRGEIHDNKTIIGIMIADRHLKKELL
jgi:ADP-ribose pyrophosphatase